MYITGIDIKAIQCRSENIMMTMFSYVNMKEVKVTYL